MRRIETAIAVLVAALALALSGCGAKANNAAAAAPAQQTPAVQNLVINGALPNGTYGQFYSATLQATGGTRPYMWLVASGDPLSAGLSLDPNSGVLNGVLTATTSFTVGVSDARSRTAIQQFTIKAASGPIKVTTTTLPPATAMHPYDVFLATNAAGGGNFSLQSGQLPAGMNLSGTGELSGTPSAAGTFNFSVAVAANGTSVQRALTLKVNTHTLRNENTQTATPISNGVWQASISPYTDPPGAPNPDNDFYSISAAAGSVVSVNIFAQRLNPPSPLEPVLEILDSAGNRVQGCNQAGDTGFTDDCVSDQIVPEFSLDAMLTWKVPQAGNFFIHVLDWRG